MLFRTSVVVWVVLVGLATGARSEAPARLPVQGVLTDPEGTPVDGTVEMHFTLYDHASSGVEMWAETQQVDVDQGLFSVYLGAVQGLNLGLFRNQGDLWLGVRVGTEAEMPRIALGSTPYSAFAQYSSHQAGAGITISVDNVISSDLGSSIDGDELEAGSVRREHLSGDGCATDQVMKFNGSAWVCASVSQASLPAGAVMMFNLSACPPGWHELVQAHGRVLVGISASDTLGGTRGSALSNLGARTVSEVPIHSHSVDPPSVASSSSGSHTHSVTDPGHTHNMQGVGISAGGTPGICHCPACNDREDPWTWSASTGISIQADGSHTHTVDPGPVESAETGVSSLDVSMPYIQLLVCQKD